MSRWENKYGYVSVPRYFIEWVLFVLFSYIHWEECFNVNFKLKSSKGDTGRYET